MTNECSKLEKLTFELACLIVEKESNEKRLVRGKESLKLTKTCYQEEDDLEEAVREAGRRPLVQSMVDLVAARRWLLRESESLGAGSLWSSHGGQSSKGDEREPACMSERETERWAEEED